VILKPPEQRMQARFAPNKEKIRLAMLQLDAPNIPQTTNAPHRLLPVKDQRDQSASQPRFGVTQRRSHWRRLPTYQPAMLAIRKRIAIDGSAAIGLTWSIQFCKWIIGSPWIASIILRRRHHARLRPHAMINIAHSDRNVFLTDNIDVGTIRALVSPKSNANLLRSKVALSAVKARKPRSTTSAAM
jgi:hypothetical protein